MNQRKVADILRVTETNVVTTVQPVSAGFIRQYSSKIPAQVGNQIQMKKSTDVTIKGNFRYK